MILTPLAIIAGIVIGLLRGGRPQAIILTQVRGWEFLAAGIALQSAGELLSFLPARPLIVAIGFVLILVAATRNIHLPGAAVAGIGITLNLAVLLVNGHVPVRFEALTGFGHNVAVDPNASGLWRLETADTKLAFLGDIVPVPVLHGAISFGDLIMLAGLIVLTMNLMLQGRASGIDVDALFDGDEQAEAELASTFGGVIRAEDYYGVPHPTTEEIDLRDSVTVIPVRPGRSSSGPRPPLFDDDHWDATNPD